jgi:hypothetical protein
MKKPKRTKPICPPQPLGEAEAQKLLCPHFVRPGYREARIRKKLGFDLHGVLDAQPHVFRVLMRDLIRQGWEIHIITGAPWSKEYRKLRKMRLPFTHFFSIVDYHVSIGTRISWDKKGNAHLENYLWDRTKALYCAKYQVSMHFDDSDIYGMFFKTPYVRYFSRSSPRIKKTHL